MENTTMVSYRLSVSYQKMNQQNRANYSLTLFHPVRPSIIIRSISNEKYCSQPHEQYEGASHSKIKENIYDGVQVFSLVWLQVLGILRFSASFANFSDQLFWKLWEKNISKARYPVNRSANRLHLNSCLHSPTLILLKNCRICLD